MTRSAYNFSGDFQMAILKALGLEDRKVKKIRIEMEVGQPVTLYVEEYAMFSSDEPYLIARLLELASWSSGAALPSEPGS